MEIFEIKDKADAVAAHSVLISMSHDVDDPVSTLDEYLVSLETARNNGYIFLGCRKNSQIVGVAGIRIMHDPWGAEPYAYLNNLVVLPEYRNQGIGSKLLSQSQEMARHHNAQGVGLNVRATNEKAKSLYRSLGYSPAAELMWLDLKK